jgi:alpha-1,6-mannosyltransferase
MPDMTWYTSRELWGDPFTRRLLLLGLVLLGAYGFYTVNWWDLQDHTSAFYGALFIALAGYALAVWLVLRRQGASTIGQIVLIFVFGFAFRSILIVSQPKLSSDMYRYVWDGRVQANHINPYLYPPNAPELAHLRDQAIWPSINRKASVTVYPAGAEVAYAVIWRIWPDNVHWFQMVMAAGDLLAGALLFILLRRLNRDPLTVLIYLWSPLVIFETAHAAHVDGLVLPFLAGAWLARVKDRDALTGLLLGMATSIKLYPILLLPILWRTRDEENRFRPVLSTPLTFLAGFLIPYIAYLSVGRGVIGFLPEYLKEQFNPGLAYFIRLLVKAVGGSPERAIHMLLLGTLLTIYLVFFLRPAPDGETAIRRCIWPIGTFTLLTQNLFPWYMLWLVPLLAIFWSTSFSSTKIFLRDVPVNSWMGWWLFCCLIPFSYIAFIREVSPLLVVFASLLQYLPLYTFLGADLLHRLRRHRQLMLDPITNRRAA